MTQQMFDNMTEPATAAAVAEPQPQPQQQQEQYGYQLNPGVFASNYIPLWAGLAEGDQGKGQAVVKSLNDSGLVQTSGIATTLYQTGQQWDWPNGWPPLQHMLVEGAARYGGTPGGDLGYRIAKAWVRNNMAIFNATQQMHEKYDVTQSGTIGGGGEYTPQVGFGWSNGVVLTFLQDYFGSYGPDTAAVGPGSRGVKLSAAPQLPPYQPQGTLEAGPVAAAANATGAAASGTESAIGSAANETTAGIDNATGTAVGTVANQTTGVGNAATGAAGSALGSAANETTAGVNTAGSALGSAGNGTVGGVSNATSAAGSALGAAGNETQAGISNATTTAAGLPGAVQALPGEAAAAAPPTEVTTPPPAPPAAGTGTGTDGVPPGAVAGPDGAAGTGV